MADNSAKKLYHYFLRKLKAFLFSRDVLSFLVFLVLSAAFWFVNALNKDREMSLTLPLSYSGFPDEMLIAEKLPDEIKLKVKDLGKNLWFYIKNKKDTININYSGQLKESGIISISNTSIYAAISERLLASTVILEMSPENIVSDYVKLHTKTVPVELMTNLSLENQYMLCFPVRPVPEKVTIYGSLKDLAAINTIKTETLVLSNIKDTINADVALLKINNVKTSVNRVRVNVCAEMFTEKVVFLPVNVINKPDNYQLKVFPAEVKVICNIGMSNYSKFNPNDLQVVLDYQQKSLTTGSKKRLSVINRKPYIGNVRIYPEEVEFLLE
jgi:hypothetical protein